MSMRKPLLLLASLSIFAASVFASGCGLLIHEGILAGLDSSAQSKKLPEDQVAKIQRGMTTKQEIEAMFGKPDAETRRPQNETAWVYSRSGVPSQLPGGRTSYHQHLVIQFDASGTVKEYEFTTGTLKSF